MITFITGLPGHAKTLFALTTIKAKAERENRPVFYHGINECKLPWHQIEPTQWMDAPDGAIIVIDEAQDIFVPMANGAKRPEHYMQLAKHRHKGHDLFFLTQHPGLVDMFVRKLVNQHYHNVRKFGMQRSTIYEWDKHSPTPELLASQKLAINTIKWKFNKEAFNWYKSAEMHTVKRSVPAKLFMAVGVIVVALGALYFFMDRYSNRSTEMRAADAKVTENTVQSSPGRGQYQAGVPVAQPFDPIADARNYVEQGTPRISGLPHTAPKYDGLTKPTAVPVPAACIQKGSLDSPAGVTCQCYSQQGTRMPVDTGMCMEFARNGYFQDFDAQRDRQTSERSDRSVDTLSRLPDLPMNRVGGGGVLTLAYNDPSPTAATAPARAEQKERSAQVHDGSIYPK